VQSCPLVVFHQVLGQVEAFDNLIPFVVDALKFSSDLGKSYVCILLCLYTAMSLCLFYLILPTVLCLFISFSYPLVVFLSIYLILARDCMAYSLVAQLKKGSAGDAKLKKGDTHFSQWFAALTRFIGTYYCRYPSTELKGLLHYLLQRLGVGDSLDLLVLKELLGIMGGAETLTEVSPAQLEGLSGGRALRAEVMGANAASTGGKGLITAANAKRATLLLREELVGSQTAIPLLLFIAQVGVCMCVCVCVCVWNVVCGMWCVVCGMWYVVCGMSCVFATYKHISIYHLSPLYPHTPHRCALGCFTTLLRRISNSSHICTTQRRMF
jgi:hypothetical protein